MDPQADPPSFDLLAPQSWHDYVDELRDWLVANRAIAGAGLIVSDVGAGRRFDVAHAIVAAGAASENDGLDVYKSTFAGIGDPPPDQAFRVRVRRGYCPIMPGNIDSEFPLAADTTQSVYAKVSCDAAGIPTAATIQVASMLPPEEEGTTDHAPPNTYIPLAEVTTSATGIVEIIQQGRGSRDLAAVVRKVQCGSNIIAYYHGPMALDPTSNPIQDLFTRVTALENP